MNPVYLHLFLDRLSKIEDNLYRLICSFLFVNSIGKEFKLWYSNKKVTSAVLENTILLIHPSSYVFFSDIPYSIIEKNYYNNNPYIKKIIILEGINHIGKFSFSNCINLEEIYIPDSVNYVGEHAFNGCCKLKNIRMSKNINKIERSTFYGCSELQSLKLSNKITNINKYALCMCTNLKKLYIDDDRKIKIKIESESIIGCNSLEFNRKFFEFIFSKYEYPTFIKI